MGQIVINYLSIFIIPFLFGAILRVFWHKSKKAYLVTAISAVVTVICFIIAQNPPVSGSELYGIRTLIAASFTVGSFVFGAVIRIIKSRQ